MGTRGLFGFFYKGIYYLIWCRHDGDSLDIQLLPEIYDLIKKYGMKNIIKIFKTIAFFDEEDFIEINYDKIINTLSENYDIVFDAGNTDLYNGSYKNIFKF